MNRKNQHYRCAPAVLLLGLVLLSMVPVTAATTILSQSLNDEQTLIEAIKSGDAGTVEVLLKSASANAAEPDGTTALHWAARQDALDIAETLIRAGAVVQAENRYGVTPLTLACTNGSNSMINLLLEAGADPNTVTPLGETVLMTAARTGAVDAVSSLLTNGADVNAREEWRGQTALMWAAVEGHVSTLEALLAAGADIDARSIAGGAPTQPRFYESDAPKTSKNTDRPTGLSALLFAIREGRTTTVRFLLGAGADVNGLAPDGTSPLALAVINAHYGLAALLLDAGADPNASDPRGSMLHALGWMRRPGSGIGGGRLLAPTGNLSSLELAKKLLVHGANPNTRITWDETRFDVDLGSVRSPSNIRVGRNYLSFIGATPFYLAAKHGDVELMRLLVEHGADPLMPTEQNITPLMAASGLGFWDGESPGPLNGVPDEERLQAVKYAIELGNNINAAAYFGDVDMEGDGVMLLLRHPFNLGRLGPNAKGDMRWSGSTALHGAAVMGSELIVRYLVDQGANIDAKNVLGWTPVMVAGGVFVANTEKAWPEVVTLFRNLGEE